MKKAMESVHDLIEEAKLRTVWWILCIFGVSYFLTHTSKSMLMNIPIAILLVAGLRTLLNEVEFRWKVHSTIPLSYLSHLDKKQLSVNDSRLSTLLPTQKWKRKIDSPVVEAAIEDFINQILRDFVIDLWYSDITPDKEAPELIRGIIMDVLGEISGRIKEVNLVDLLTRDVVNLVGDHLDLFRRNQSSIGVDVMGTLSSEERDERLKHHLLASKELHPALISPECEYKVLQRLVGGLFAVVLRPKEAQCPLVRCIARELLTCLVVQPMMDFASPGYINELFEYIIVSYNDEDIVADQSSKVESHKRDQAVAGEHYQGSESILKKCVSSRVEGTDLSLSRFDNIKAIKSNASGKFLASNIQDEPLNPRSAEWAKAFDAANQRRTEVLMPENLENMWAIGRNYKKKLEKKAAPGPQASEGTGSLSVTAPQKQLSAGIPVQKPKTSIEAEDENYMKLPTRPQRYNQATNPAVAAFGSSIDLDQDVFLKEGFTIEDPERTAVVSSHDRNMLKRSNSTSDLHIHPRLEDSLTSVGTAPIISEYYSADAKKPSIHSRKSVSDMVIHSEGLHVPKLRCRVVGAYFEKLGSKSFAVYSIAVTGTDNNTWFVKRRYRNFERLHRHLKDIPNYTLQLPPKRIFSSSTEDSFVHQRCIQLDKYLQDLLSIANVAEQHEVWDFLSSSSKNYSFGKSSSAMRTLAVNVDDAVDDIVRQFKGVSDGLLRKVVGSPSSFHESSSLTSRNLSWNTDDLNKLIMRESTSESINSFSDNEEGDKANHEQQELKSTAQANGWHSDNEVNSRGFPPRVIKHGEVASLSNFKEIHVLKMKPATSCESRYQESSLALMSASLDDPTVVPPEWTPPNLSVPVLNLVDNIFQLKRRGWLRRQVFWISKQILQLVMEDAIDDWLSRQIHWLRREDVIAQGIRWLHNVLWPDGTFFLRLRTQGLLNDIQTNHGSWQDSTKQSGRSVTLPGSFEQQLEAARRANDLKRMIFDGAPTTLVSLIGHKQYRRCARDVYYFLQSTVCLKQLGYGILELILISVFPELRDIVMDIHEKMRVQPE
ncbi:hypothetical protein F511_25964 [Dorcoceras hygrometricum]|uniref:Sorting nexin-13 n=1 Tax=Dorcoceras hygrometricum TaxID=472368 RepID=A0A2Z7A5E6_9LAMI|nr:hypothetical protein F511_25964 [Dorcoceras hygrometricum]